jgi:hypothetical protein
MEIRTMHLGEETIQRVLNGELEHSEESRAHLHLGECAECRARVEVASQEEKETHELLRSLDHPAPAVRAEAIAARAQQRPRHGGMRRAAGILVVVGLAGAAYALPGSPLPQWAASALSWIRESIGVAPATAPDAVPKDSGSPMSGIAVSPGKNLVIVFVSSQSEGNARVSLSEESDIVVRGPSGSATFTSEPERIVVHNEGSTQSYEIAVPQNAPRVEIRVGDKAIFLKEGATMAPENLPSLLSLQTSP